MSNSFKGWLGSGVILGRRLGLYPYGFRGNYRSWTEGIAAAGGDYEARAIVSRNIRSTEQFVRQLRVAPDHHAATLRIRDIIERWCHESIVPRVFDFGGALGRHYFGVRSVLPTSRRLDWTVCETPTMSLAGNRHFPSDELSFVDAAEKLDGHYDIGIASGSLQYVEHPWLTLRFLMSKASLLIVDRLPLIEGASDRLTIQRVPPWVYRASYPAWFFARANWIHATENHVLESWILSERVWLDRKPVTDAGCLLRASLDSPSDLDGTVRIPRLTFDAIIGSR
jgi:putative methyltransferase (TIGR04325 family)